MSNGLARVSNGQMRRLAGGKAGRRYYNWPGHPTMDGSTGRGRGRKPSKQSSVPGYFKSREAEVERYDTKCDRRGWGHRGPNWGVYTKGD